MTREDAKNKCHGIAYPEAFIQALEALGLLKFEEEKKDIIGEAKLIVTRSFTQIDAQTTNELYQTIIGLLAHIDQQPYKKGSKVVIEKDDRSRHIGRLI